MPKNRFKNDQYKRTRGGYSRLLDVYCASCSTHICYYQKDGPGILKRMYFDRMIDSQNSLGGNLTCPKCKKVLAVPMIYKKEDRPAFRLFVGAVGKKIVNSNAV